MAEGTLSDRLDSWKEIAAYMRRDVKTVQRWEKREGMPVHRHLHDKMGSVYAFRTELDAWTNNRRPTTPDGESIREAPPGFAVRSRWVWGLVGVGTILVAGLVATVVWPRRDAGNPLENARFLPLTDFNGIEQAAAISGDGKLAAFLSDRDGQMDVWVTQIGSGDFHNMTRGAAREIVNSSVRTLGFSPDGTIVTFWERRVDDSQKSKTSVWGIPVLGGSPRVYLDGIAEYDWTDDGSRVVYHTSEDGDPTFVRDAGEGSTPRYLFSMPTGLHSHFPLWSPDRAFIYFVQGTVPNRMDIWRVKPSGSTPERLTHHDALVTYPVFLDPRTLVYLATDRDGSGPWIYSMDVERRLPRRVSVGIERYTSLAVSTRGRRLVATVASSKGTLWRVPIGGEPARVEDARPISLTTGNGSSPRVGDGFLLYVSSKGTSDSIWKRQGERASELWTSPDTRVTGRPVLSPDGQRIAFSTRRHDGLTQLWVANADGTNARTVATSLKPQGAPAWAPTGQTLTVAALVDGTPSLFNVPVDDDGSPVRLVHEHSIDPAWSPDGVIVFSGADVGTTFPLKAVTAAGAPHKIPELRLTRGARRVVFLPGGRSLVTMRGELSHKNLWAIDLETGDERQLTDFAPGFDIRDFDIDKNGRELVVEQVQEHSDIVLLELP
jgi:Tol biopolymer transport system component